MDNIKIRHRGLFVDYDPNGVHKDVIYFATDTQQLMLNGRNYGGSNTIIVDALDTDDSSSDVIRFKLSTQDYKKAYNGSTTAELIVVFGDNIYFPGTQEEMYLLCFRYLKKITLVTDDVEKIWVVDNDYLSKLQKYAELTIYPIPDDDGMDCIINFEASTVADDIKKLQNQIDLEATEIQSSWTAKEGSNYTAESKDITTAIYDLDQALKKEETECIAADKEITERLDDIQPKVEQMYVDLYGSGNEDSLDTGNAVLVNKTTLKKISVKPDKLSNYSPDEWEPIGVVVIPELHDVYGTREAGIVSLKYASVFTPDTGTITCEGISYGNTTPELNSFNQVARCGSGDGQPLNNINGESINGLIPLMNSDVGEIQCPHDSLARYYPPTNYSKPQNIGYVPSPYLLDGSRNLDYCKTDNPTSIANALSDFSGKTTSAFLCEKSTFQKDWKTANWIVSTRQEVQHYPAACACWRYHTIGTNQGDWYLPACGEFGDIPPRFDLINQTITILQEWGDITCTTIVSTVNGFLSSSIYDNQNCRHISTRSGMINYNYYNSDGYYVRPFIRLKRKALSKFYTKDETDEIVDNLSTEINDALDDKVDKVEGKQLSTEDFTTHYREKLDELIEGKLLIDLADEEDAKAKLQQALGQLTPTDTAQTLNNNTYIIHSLDKCEFKVTSLEYTGGNWIVRGASIVHQQGNRFFELFSYAQSTNTLTVGAHEINAASIGLGNVDNTSDEDKPVSNAVDARIINEILGLNLVWDSDNKKIILKNKDNQQVAELDAAEFVKDGIVDSVEIKNDKLVINFNTDSNKTPIELPLSEFVNIYEGEKAITIDDTNRLIKLKISPDSTDYLKQGDNGLQFDDSKVEEIKTTAENAIKIDGSNGTAAGVSALINKLETGTSNPTDNDYYVCQYAGGGTTTTTYYRRPLSALWNWIKGKADSVYLKLTGGTIKNGSSSNPIIIDTDSTNESSIKYNMAGVTKATAGYNKNYGAFLWNAICNKVMGLKDDGTPHVGNREIPLLDANGMLPANSVYINPFRGQINTVGWYRVYESASTNADGRNTILLNISRDYNNLNNESYTLFINLCFGGAKSINQVSGWFNNQAITKIRVLYKNNAVSYIDIYYNTTTNNNVWVSGIGTGKLQGPVLSNDIPSGYTSQEFELGKGFRTNSSELSPGLNADLLDGLHSSAFPIVSDTIRFMVGSSPANITTAQFLTKLTNLGAFSVKAWAVKCSWEYAANDTITDTGCGNIQLAGSLIEVFSQGNGAIKFIRITTSPASTGGAIANSVFIYRDNGSGYTPNWKRLANTTDTIANATNASNSDTVDNWHAATQTGKSLKKSGYVHSATAGLSSYWGKLATFNVTTNENKDITLYLHDAFHKNYGFLNISIRINSGGENYEMKFLAGNIATNTVRLYKASSSPRVFELWYNTGGQYNVINAVVLSETDRVGTETGDWCTMHSTAFTTVQTPTLPSYIEPTYVSLNNNVATANKLNTNAGSVTQPVYFADGIPKACSLPTATTSANGLMSSNDKIKLDNATQSVCINININADASLIETFSNVTSNMSINSLDLDYILAKVTDNTIATADPILYINLTFTKSTHSSTPLNYLCRVSSINKLSSKMCTVYFSSISNMSNSTNVGVTPLTGMLNINGSNATLLLSRENYIKQLGAFVATNNNYTIDIKLQPGDNVLNMKGDADGNTISIKRPDAGWLVGNIYKLYVTSEATTNSAGGCVVNIDDYYKVNSFQPSNGDSSRFVTLSRAISIVTIIPISSTKVMATSISY